ncbi:MAG: PqqD family protein [Elusimicrobiales bacterium]
MVQNTVLRRNSNMISRVIGGETVLLPLYRDSREINCIYTLNPAAAWVWRRIDGKTGLDKIAGEAAGEFRSSPAEIRTTLSRLAAELKSIKAVM